MSLSVRLAEYVRAAFAGIWVQSHEHEDALAEVAGLCRQEGWQFNAWDVERGLQGDNQVHAASSASTALALSASDPLAAVRSIGALVLAERSGEAEGASEAALWVLVNFHRFLGSAEIVQAIAHGIQRGKTARTFLIVLAPVVQVPVELEKHFVVLEHELPDRPQLHRIAQGVATEVGELPAGDDLARLLDAAVGLTRYEAEGAFSLSLARHGALQPEVVWELKEGMLKKGGLLNLHRGGEAFVALGGLAALKIFCAKALAGHVSSAPTSTPSANALASAASPARPRGILLLGVPGTGKSAFAKALGNETGRPTVVLDVGALLGGIVGETESRTRQALKAIDAMAPCICFLDEVEKALAGASGQGGQGDSGVGARLFGTFLSWLSDHQSDVFVVCTANDVSKLPPEFARSERFDALWFLDLPTAGEKKQIWDLHVRAFNLGSQPLPKDSQWTGAEIRACCRLASLLDITLVEAAHYVVPIAVTAAESVLKLRTWATGRCLDATLGGVYCRGADAPSPPRRVSRPGSN